MTVEQEIIVLQSVKTSSREAGREYSVAAAAGAAGCSAKQFLPRPAVSAGRSVNLFTSQQLALNGRINILFTWLVQQQPSELKWKG